MSNHTYKRGRKHPSRVSVCLKQRPLSQPIIEISHFHAVSNPKSAKSSAAKVNVFIISFHISMQHKCHASVRCAVHRVVIYECCTLVYSSFPLAKCSSAFCSIYSPIVAVCLLIFYHFSCPSVGLFLVAVCFVYICRFLCSFQTSRLLALARLLYSRYLV